MSRVPVIIGVCRYESRESYYTEHKVCVVEWLVRVIHTREKEMPLKHYRTIQRAVSLDTRSFNGAADLIDRIAARRTRRDLSESICVGTCILFMFPCMCDK